MLTCPHCTHHSLCFHTPAPYHPYTHKVPSQHASNAACHPYARVVPSRHASNAAYHPSAHIVPSQHPHTGLILMLLQRPQDETTILPPISVLTTPYASAPPPYLLHCLQLLCSHSTLKICLQACTQPLLPSLCSGIRSIGYSGLLAYTMNAITEICGVAFSSKRLLVEIGRDIHNVVVRV
ncbi:hypothetical protein O181_022959 [Austropuccinia psidii MF-1]|uniref:Uncharacterized protein n=1 Tax=Austropuccinia psidii MF-1 TaxID=1389203 RepID=A0A9Q3CFS9_9BASI|nr:hypothetical protein [Austropuccinia psidii MF-1]